MGILGFASNFAQAYNSSVYESSTYDPSLYSSSTEVSTGAAAAAAGMMMIMIVIYALVGIFLAVCMWKIFTKAGKPGWASIVPFYNSYVLLQIAGRPGWWLLLLFVPIASFVVWIIVANDIAKSFGKDTGFTVLLILLPFIAYPMLAFGSATYHGPAAAEGGATSAPAAFAPAAASPMASVSASGAVPVAPAAQPTMAPETPADQQQRPPQAPLVQ